jgi:hypothetical protein
VRGSSEYPPVSGVEPEPREVKTEDLRLAQSVGAHTAPASDTSPAGGVIGRSVIGSADGCEAEQSNF